ncbi:uncharacterized protein EV420DRAFT_1274625, partial [Desarmillaria tabescens]
LQNVEKWLEPLNSEAKLRGVRERRQLETCEWLRGHDQFVSWYSAGSLLWLNGIPGNGKTVLASFVIDHLKKSVTSEEIVLFAFADFQDVRSTDVVVLLRTLLAQLLDHCKPEDFVEDMDFTELEKTMHRHHADRPKFLQYLSELLEKASEPWKRVFIVIDALDECVQKNRRESIAAIRKLAYAGSKISVFVTSRGEQDIVDVLSSVPTISLGDETERVQDDIQRLIEDKMNTSHLSLKHFHESVRTRITLTLLEKSKGMFRLIDCQLESLAKAKFESDIDEILQNLPADLNSMYERILQSVEEEGQRAVKIVQRTLWWLVGSHRQLRLAELMEAVTIEAGNYSPNTDLELLSGKHLLEMCSSLVRHNTKTNILVLPHASVQVRNLLTEIDIRLIVLARIFFSDYLKETKYRNYHIPSFSFLHRHTAGLISAYLHYGDFQNGPCTTSQHLFTRLGQHPFLVYVVSNWDVHIVKMYETCPESEMPPDFDKLLALFDDSEKNLLAHHIDGFIRPRYCAGPSWLLTEEGLLPNPPRRDLSDMTSIGELDYMVYPLVSEGPASLVRDLLRKLPQFKERPLFYFGTPLMVSIFAGKLDTVSMLLQDLHVDVNTCAWHYRCNHEVVSPIFLATNDIIIGAANYGRIDILKVLISHGVDVNTRSKISGNTVLHAAIIYGLIDSVKALIDAGCDINPRSKGKTPLDFALNQQSSDLGRYLLEKGALFDQCLPQNFVDLEWAVGELWYPETRRHLAKLDVSPKSQLDIEKIVRLLKMRLSSPEPLIIRAILDFAELWIVTSAERHELVRVFERSPRESYISTPPIAGGPENPVRRIVFMTSHGYQRARPQPARGLYSDSSTWFEAEVESSPGVLMRIQDNVRADDQSRTHVNVWDHQDAPSSIEAWMSKIKAGDKISVYPRARSGLCHNYVESGVVMVYTSYI